MSGARSYSLSDLVTTTGFDRRTIVYYIQSGLLPKVGRRGPHTRYPEECLTRLLFIKGVKELQASGSLLTATLAEIRRALAARDAAGIRDLLDRGLPAESVIALFDTAPAPPPEAPAQIVEAQNPATPVSVAARDAGGVHGPAGERRSYGLADAGIRKRFGVEKIPETAHEEAHPRLPALPIAAAEPDTPLLVTATGTAASESGPAEAELGYLLRELEVRPTLNTRRSPPGSPEQWTEIPITSRVYLSVRGLSEDDTPLAEAVARVLKRALRARTNPVTP